MPSSTCYYTYLKPRGYSRTAFLARTWPVVSHVDENGQRRTQPKPDMLTLAADELVDEDENGDPLLDEDGNEVIRIYREGFAAPPSDL